MSTQVDDAPLQISANHMTDTAGVECQHLSHRPGIHHGITWQSVSPLQTRHPGHRVHGGAYTSPESLKVVINGIDHEPPPVGYRHIYSLVPDITTNSLCYVRRRCQCNS